MDISQFIERHADWVYLILFVWTIIEGETVVIFCGYLAASKPEFGLSVPLIALSSLIGSMSGDNLWFFLGRRKGKAFLAKRPGWNKKAEKVYRIFEHHQDWLMIGFRFIYGVRNVTPFVLGISNVRAKKFVICNLIGATVWAISFTLAGYLAGQAVESYLSHYKWHVLGGFCVVVLTTYLVRAVVRSAKGGRDEQLPTAPPELDPEIHPQPESENEPG